MPIDALASLRIAAADHGLDANHDQVASPQEIEGAIATLVALGRRENEYADGAERRRDDVNSGGRYGDHDEAGQRKNEIEFARTAAQRYYGLAADLRAALRQGEPVAFMSADFQARFAGLSGEALAALVTADVRGDNDGKLAADEYAKFNRRPGLRVFGSKRFEGRFGEAAHRQVLAALAAPKAGGALPKRIG